MNEGESAENGGIAAEATDRKLRSESILRAEGVPFIAWLPAIETADEALKRSKEEVALRTLCLSLVAAKAEGLEQDAVERVLESYGLRPHLSPKELAFVFDNAPRSTTGLNSSGDTKPPGPCFGHWASWPNSASRLRFATWNSPQRS